MGVLGTRPRFCGVLRCQPVIGLAQFVNAVMYVYDPPGALALDNTSSLQDERSALYWPRYLGRSILGRSYEREDQEKMDEVRPLDVLR